MAAIKRAAPRRDLKWNVAIIGADGSALGYCKTSNVSKSGAKLTFQKLFDVPDNFALAFSANGKVTRACQVMWRKDNEIGVRFTAAEKIVIDRPLP